jgi:hypothetical protein
VKFELALAVFNSHHLAAAASTTSSRTAGAQGVWPDSSSTLAYDAPAVLVAVAAGRAEVAHTYILTASSAGITAAMLMAARATGVVQVVSRWTETPSAYCASPAVAVLFAVAAITAEWFTRPDTTVVAGVAFTASELQAVAAEVAEFSLINRTTTGGTLHTVTMPLAVDAAVANLLPRLNRTTTIAYHCLTINDWHVMPSLESWS